MLNKIKTNVTLNRFLTNKLLENEVGVIIDKDMPQNSFVAINIDEYYHHIGLEIIPAIADILLVAQKLSQKEQHHIYIVEMKNIDSPHKFKVKNIYDKFYTAIEDFMKKNMRIYLWMRNIKLNDSDYSLCLMRIG